MLLALLLLPLLLESLLASLQLTLVLLDHAVLLLLACLHLLENVVSHAVLELLSSFLSFFHFVLAVSLLLLQHLGVSFLSTQVLKSFLLFDTLLNNFLFLVFL